MSKAGWEGEKGPLPASTRGGLPYGRYKAKGIYLADRVSRNRLGRRGVTFAMTSLNVLAVYKELHEMPELGFREYKTAAYLAAKLEQLGYTVRRKVGGTGVIGELKGQELGPTLMLRADMDALPFVIEGQPCNIHACGHDSHSAMVLTAASQLVGRVKRGTLKILFQPAEELLTGALRVIEDGGLEGVDMIMGLHIRPSQDMPCGRISPAVKHASSSVAVVEVIGKSCHGSRPHLGVNAIEAASGIINAVAMLRLDPEVSWSCKPTIISGGGKATNVIPAKAGITFDIRAGNNATMQELQEKLARIVPSVAAAYGAQAKLSYPSGTIPAAELSAAFTEEVAACIKETLGEDKYYPPISSPGGEDFHYYSNKLPRLKAAFIGIGAGAVPGLHDPAMHFDTKVMEDGVAVLVAVALKELG